MKKNTVGRFYNLFSQSEFIKSVLNLKVLHLCVIPRKSMKCCYLITYRNKKH